MTNLFTKMLGAAFVVTLLAGCTPLLVGAGGAVVADQAVEAEEGGDGLF